MSGSDKHAALWASAPVQDWLGPIILLLRTGFWRKPVGYRTRVKGLSRVRIHTKDWTKAVEVDFARHGDAWSDAHYHDILFKVWFSHRMDAFDDAMMEASGWTYASRDPRWTPLLVGAVEREVGQNARWLCKMAFDAARFALDNPAENLRRKEDDLRRSKHSLKRYARTLLKSGLSLKGVHDLVDAAVVEDVMGT